MSPREVARLARDVGGWRGAELVKAVQVVLAESRGNPRAVYRNANGSTDRGLWQLNTGTQPDDQVAFDPVAATRFARKLYDKRGWRPWYGARNTDPKLAELARKAAAAVDGGTVQAGLPLVGAVLALLALNRDGWFRS